MRGKRIDWLDTAMTAFLAMSLATVTAVWLPDLGADGFLLLLPFVVAVLAVVVRAITYEPWWPEGRKNQLWEIRNSYKVGRPILVKPEGLPMLPFTADPDWAVKGTIVGLQTDPVPAYVVQLEGHEGRIALAEEVVHVLPPPDTQPEWTAYCFGYMPERIDFSKN